MSPDHLPLGNKCDLENERQVPFERACNLAKDRGILAALETSAKVILKGKHKHRRDHLKLTILKISLFSGEPECGRSLSDDGQRADVS